MSIRIRTLDESFNVVATGDGFKSVQDALSTFDAMMKHVSENKTATYQVFSDRTGYVYNEYSTYKF